MDKSSDYSNVLFLRPRFSIVCKQSSSQVMKIIVENLNSIHTTFKTKISGNHVFVDVSEDQAHFWSPQLHFKIIDEDDQTKVKGLFGPKPQVWTLFMFVHFIVAMAFIVFAILLYVNHKFGGNIMFPIVMLVALPVIWFLLYVLGQLGKLKGKQQMDALTSYMEELLQNVY